MSFKAFVQGALVALLMCAAYTVEASVGLIQFTAGDVKIRNAAGQVRAAVKGGTVDEGDTIFTAPSASAQIKMSDGGIIAVRPETELKVDTYRYAGKEDGNERAVMSLVKGGFRTITGLIGRTNKQNYTITTPTAVIGIRGTDHEPIVIPAIAGAGKPSAPPGTYDKVNVGQAFIRTPLGEVNIRQNQVGYAAPNQAPTLLPKMPDMFKATPPVRQAQAEKKEEQQKQQEAQKQEQTKQASGGQSGQSQTSASGDKPTETQSASSTTSSTSTTSTATSEVRATAVVDATPVTASTGTTSATTAVVPTATTVPPVVTTTTTTSPPAVVQEIKATSSSETAAKLDLTSQTTTSATGTTTTISDSTTTPTPATPTSPTTTTPSIASSSYGALVMSQQPVSNTSKAIEGVTTRLQPQTSYVLDQNNALTEIKSIAHVPSDTTGLLTGINDVDLKLTGGKLTDVYVNEDKTMYIGRQEGGSILVTPNNGTASAFTQSLNNSSAHWLIGLQPGQSAMPGGVGTMSNAQTVVGTSVFGFGLHGATGSGLATHPTDSQGNVGTLQGAVVLANFSSQTVTALLDVKFSKTDTAAPSTRELEIFGAASNVPIKLGGFEAIAGTSTAPYVYCTGPDCSAREYQGTIRGMFSGPASGGQGLGTSAGLTYSFGPTGTATNAPYEDLIQGAAVLSSVGSVPTVGTVSAFANNSNVRHELIYDTYQRHSTTNVNVAVARDTLSVTAPTEQTINGPRSNTNYLFDAEGNLVRVLDTPYAVFDHGNNVSTTTGYTAPTPLANAQISMGGYDSTAADLFSDTNIGIRMGRWQGGLVNVTDLATGQAYVEELGGRSMHWLVRTAPTSLPISGTYHYSKAAATQPTDAYGNVGTVDRARLEVDFSRSTVSAGVSLTMPSGSGGSLGTQSLTGYFTDAPLTSSGFNVSSNPNDNPANTDNLHVNCRGGGCAADQTYGGRIRGGFSTGSATPNTAEGAYFRYTFVTNYADAAAAAAQSRVFNDYIDGFVAFKQGADISKPSTDIFGTVPGGQSTTTPAADAVVLYAYNYMDGSNSFQSRSESFYARGGGYEVDSVGKLISANGYFDDDKRIAGSNAAGSFSTSTQLTTATNDFTVAYGRYVSPSLSGLEKGNSFNGRAVADTFHWMRGPAIYPFYLSMVTENPSTIASGTTVAYAPMGGIVTDASGAFGTINSSSLSVNFNAQTVSAAVNATVGNNSTFNAVANGIALEELGSFWATRNGPTRHNIQTLTLNNSSNGVSGNISGALMGPGLEGAGFVFDFYSGSTGPRAMGSVVLGAPTYTNTSNATVPFSASPLTDYHLGMVASGMNAVGQLNALGGGVLSEYNLYRADLGALSPGRVQFVDYQTANPQSPQWSLLKFDGIYPFAYGCSTSGCSGATEMPARYAIADATGGGPLPVNNTAIPAPTAKAVEAYYDAETGMRWGRWGGGKINVGDRGSGGGTGAVPSADSSSSINQIDLTANNWHYLLTGVQSGPVVLPVSGTYTYTLVGGTSPTSYTPGQTGVDVGTLTSASLVANFTAKTVNVGVNLTTPASGTWSASAANVPILKDTAFSVEKALSGSGNLAITRNGSSANTAGTIVGGFAGQTGQGAGIAYSLNQGGATGVTVSGVAAFKR
ncbi:MAG: FecR domain-containing protein [Rhodospirillaceae bacterium]